MSTVTFKVSNKGSAKSGNYGHAGIPGHLGGSAPKSANAIIPPDKPLYHYTKADNVESIQQSGLRPSGHALLGNAIYLTDDPKSDYFSQSYGNDTRMELRANVRSTAEFSGYADYAQWALEHAKGDMNANPINMLKAQGYDSAVVQSDHGPMYMIFDPSAIKIVGVETMRKHKEMTIHYSVKGSAKSGNYLHAGRPGKVGGSTAYSIGGKTAGEWKDAQDKLSAEGHAKLMDGLVKAGVDNDKARAFADRLDEHRSAVMDETFEIAASGRYDLSRADQATLTQNLLNHDYDKYDPAVAMAYINKATDSKGFWNAVVEHHDNASHHPESWQTSRDRADRMPYPYAIEMVGDWVATAKYHKSPIDAYYNKNKHSFVLHPDTRRLAEYELYLAVKHNAKELTVQYRVKAKHI